MKKVLILGAHGQIARVATDLFLKQNDVRLTLFLRNARRIKNPDPSRVQIFEGDVLDVKTLESAVAGQDVVYVNLAGDLERQAQNIVAVMDRVGVKRLILISYGGLRRDTR